MKETMKKVVEASKCKFRTFSPILNAHVLSNTYLYIGSSIYLLSKTK